MGDVSEVNLSVRRRQMGESLALLSSVGPRPHHELGDHYWIAMSGAPSADANVAFVEANDPVALRHVVDVIVEIDVPTTLVLAGSALALSDSWQHQGDMPLMEAPLAVRDVALDSRVRAASAPDVETVSELLARAYGIDRDESDALASFAALDHDVGAFWLLEEGSVAVATVFTAVIGDAVCVWSLATPEEFGRRGHASALLNDVLARAYEAGASVGLLAATPAGEPLYRRAGWQTIETWRMFTRSRGADVASHSRPPRQRPSRRVVQ